MMANSSITIKTSEYRPCMVRGVKALFHRWSHVSEIRPPSLLKGGHPGGTVSGELAIVETEDGMVHEVHPDAIRFLDSDGKFKEYDWGEGESNAE